MYSIENNKKLQSFQKEDVVLPGFLLCSFSGMDILEFVRIFMTGSYKGPRVGKRMEEVHKHLEYEERCRRCGSKCWREYKGDFFVGLGKVSFIKIQK